MKNNFIKILFLLASLVNAASSRSETPEKASYRISVPEGGGVMSSGSGTGIAPRIVVTNSHVVGHRTGHKALVFNDDTSTQGTVLFIDRHKDLAFINTIENVPYVQLSDRDGDNGHNIVTIGYGTNAIKRRGFGTIQEIKDRGGCLLMVGTVGLESGDSGSGVFNENNELIGVNWGTDGNGNYFTPLLEVDSALTAWETQCGDGNCFVPRRYKRGNNYNGGSGMQPISPEPVTPAPKPKPQPEPPEIAPEADQSKPIKNEINVDKLLEQINKLIDDKISKIPAPQIPQIPPACACNPEKNCNCEKTTNTDIPAVVPKEYFVLVTADLDICKGVNQKSDLLKSKGVEIVTVKLKPKETTVNDELPRLFIMPRRELISGSQNILNYYQLLVK